MKEESFTRNYPLSIYAVIAGTISFFQMHETKYNLLPPATKSMRKTAEYAGYNYGYLRTTLSVWKKEKLLISGYRGKGWFFSDKYLALQANMDQEATEQDGYTFAFFTFSAENHKERNTTRELLKGLGFRMFASNVYMNTVVDIPGINRTLHKFGLEKNVFLFHTCTIDNPSFIERLKTLWHIDEYKLNTEKFYRQVIRYLENTPAEQSYLRYIYASGAFYEHLKLKRPKIHDQHVLKEDNTREILDALQNFKAEFEKDIISFYRTETE